MTTDSASRTGHGLSSVAFIVEYATVRELTPSARIKMAAPLNPGCRRSPRSAYRRSWDACSSHVAIQTLRASSRM
jgi:hypothetical protein